MDSRTSLSHRRRRAVRPRTTGRVRRRHTKPARVMSKGVAMLLELRDTIDELMDIGTEDSPSHLLLAAELDSDTLMDVALVVEDVYRLRFSESELVGFGRLQDIADCLDQRSRHGACGRHERLQRSDEPSP